MSRRVRTNNHVERTNRMFRFLEKVRYKWRRRKTLVRFVVLTLDEIWSQLGCDRGPGEEIPQGRPPRQDASPYRARTSPSCVRMWWCSRYLFVQHHLTASERKTLARITRGQPQLRSLRRSDGGGLSPVRPAVPDGDGIGQAGASCGRGCGVLSSCGTVLKKLFLPGLEKALVFLDEKLLGATSNAVERGTVGTGRCRRRCTGCGRNGRSRARVALDLLRERQARSRAETTETLHKARAA